MFFIYHNKNQLYDKNVILDTILVFFLSKTLKKERLQKIGILFEKQTRVAHNLSKLLCLKIKQIDGYGYILDSKSNFYYRYQMIQSFFVDAIK